MNRIKELRLSKKLSQQKLAKELFVNQTAVSQWERGVTTPNLQLLTKLAEYFDVTVDYIIGKSESKKNPHVDNDKEELTADENKLLKNFRELNEEGQYMLISQSEALVASGLYIKNQEPRIHLENEA